MLAVLGLSAGCSSGVQSSGPWYGPPRGGGVVRAPSGGEGAHGSLRLGDYRMVAAPQLGDIAQARWDTGGPVILYNPRIMQEVGPAVAYFFEVHEKSHHDLDHVPRGAAITTPENRVKVARAFEREADCRAARYLAAHRPDTLPEIIRFFQSKTSNDWYHDPGYARAALIAECANR